MSTARGFGLNGKSYYTNITKPMDVNVQFTVTPTNGLGVTSVKSNGYVRNVFMHTSTTPAAHNGYTNPNPDAGYGIIQFNNNFNYFLGGFGSLVSATATSTKIDDSALTAGKVYVITVVGDSTLAVWQAIGLPLGLTPTVGQSFTALTVGAGAGTSTSRVQVPTSSGISAVEIVGNPNTMIANSSIAAYGGAWVTVQFLGEVLTVNSYTPAGTVAAPTFTGESYTPAGTVAAPVLTMDSYTPAGTNNGDTPPLFAGTPATLTGTNSAPVFSGSAHTLAGTNSAPVFTGSAGSLTGTVALGAAAPATGSVVNLYFRFDGSSVTVDGI